MQIFWVSSMNRHHLSGFLHRFFFFPFPHRRLCVNCVTRSPPLTQPWTLWRSKDKQTAVQTPQIIMQGSHWERCVESGSLSAPVSFLTFVSICYDPGQSEMVWGEWTHVIACSSGMFHIYIITGEVVSLQMVHFHTPASKFTFCTMHTDLV